MTSREKLALGAKLALSSIEPAGTGRPLSVNAAHTSTTTTPLLNHHQLGGVGVVIRMNQKTCKSKFHASRLPKLAIRKN